MYNNEKMEIHTERVLHHMLLRSSFRTMDPDKAALFLVPAYC